MRSTTVPSGSVVGSSKTSRPLSSRARSGLMRLLYGFLAARQAFRPHYGAVRPAETKTPSGSNWLAFRDAKLRGARGCRFDHVCLSCDEPGLRAEFLQLRLR